MKAFTKKEIDILLESANYYLTDATQYGDEKEKYFQESCGFNIKDPRYNILSSAIRKLEKCNK